MLRRLRSLAPVAVTCGALLSFSFALLGYSLLGFLYLTRYYAPAAYHYVRPLHFDYTGYVAVAVAPLSPNLKEQSLLHNNLALPGAAAALLPKSRFLPSGTQVAVHVVLTIPADHTDLFQVTGELMTNATHIAARSTRTYINTPQPYAYRLTKQLMFLPLHVVGWGHGDWARVDLPLFDEYEERDDAPVAMFRARLASRNASGGGLPPPPVHRAELHARLRLGFFRTALFWLRPGLALSVVVLLLGLFASIVGTTGTLALLLVAYFLRRWIIKTEAVAAAARAKAKAQRGALPPPGRKGPPYGSFEDALSYSLAHAEFYRDNGAQVLGVEDDDTAGAAFGRQTRGRASRQGSAFPDRPKTYEDDTLARGGSNGARLPLMRQDSPTWSGSSGTTAAGAATAGRPLSRQDSDTAVAATSKASALSSVSTVKRQNGSDRPLLSPSPVPLAADGEEDEDEPGSAAADISGPGAAMATCGNLTDGEHQPAGHGEGHDQGNGAAGTSDPGLVDEDAVSDEELEHMLETARYDEQGSLAGGKTPDMGEDATAEGQFSDLEPQADNEAAAALRRRAVYTWKA
ncbi:hypothetical protein VOLCADRAFT_115661 [Volvox carteri f. nagariensis]|uniref:Seipin n=1 Tax=Volvox carteri f. nagariensis TaxID=3068 RepID=D8THI0_VOLCA|nr:uncharacterized protein VOLCADRAFT_115661 [Volvox carteri f. nagariensis]EFJ52714.1 hypothetical protein VOLCADRAFT_115661 [Volvox carteri f. nagariensis]|eukprot:XP_002945719.1 hypothetical protein VOLCADRAFT_115661 [Volvox carteri f. nagariensis]